MAGCAVDTARTCSMRRSTSKPGRLPLQRPVLRSWTIRRLCQSRAALLVQNMPRTSLHRSPGRPVPWRMDHGRRGTADQGKAKRAQRMEQLPPRGLSRTCAPTIRVSRTTRQQGGLCQRRSHKGGRPLYRQLHRCHRCWRLARMARNRRVQGLGTLPGHRVPGRWTRKSRTFIPNCSASQPTQAALRQTPRAWAPSRPWYRIPS